MDGGGLSTNPQGRRAGIDGVTAETYEAHLEANLQDLLGRIKSGRYVAPPVRRAYIACSRGS